MKQRKRRGLFFWILLVGFFFFSLGFVNALVVSEGQAVKISVSGLSCNSKTANLVYYEVDSNGDDLISSGSYGLPGSVEFDSSGNTNFIWNAVWFEDLDSSDGNNNPDIKFVVSCDGGSKESSVLEVLKGEYDIIYQDNFDDGDFTNIDAGLENGMTWSTLSNIYSVVNNNDFGGNVLYLKEDSLYSTILSNQVIYGNSNTFEFRVSARNAGIMRVIFLYKDELNYYYLNFAYGTNGIYRVMNGVETKISSEEYDKSIEVGTLGEIGIYKIYYQNTGSKIIFKVDKDGYSNLMDYEVKAEDLDLNAVNLFDSGKVGFYEDVGQYKAMYFDDIKIYSGLKIELRPHPISTLYVDSEKGSDTNSGTIESPFKTIAKAASVALPGDNVSINSGIYNEGNVLFNPYSSPEEKIIVKGTDSSNKPLIKGSIVKEISEWDLYKSEIYKTNIDWIPRLIYYEYKNLMRANIPDQMDSEDRYDTSYYIKVNETYNTGLNYPEKHYKIYDPLFLTQEDNYWKGCEIEFYDGYYNNIGTFDVLESNLLEHSLTISNYDKGRIISGVGGLGGGDRYALANCPQALDSYGEYAIVKGNLNVESFNENSGKLFVNVKMVDGSGTASRIKFHVFNGTGYNYITNSSSLINGQSANFELNLTKLNLSNVDKVYATIDSINLYDFYVKPYEGQNLDEIELSYYSYFIPSAGRKDYLEFKDLNIEKFQYGALNFGDASSKNIIVDSCEINHNGGSGVICMNNCNNLTINNSFIHDNLGRAVVLGRGGSNHRVLNSEIARNQDDGVYIGTGTNKDVEGYVDNVLIKGNNFHDQGLGKAHPDNLQLFGARNITIDSNYFFQEGHQNMWSTYNGDIIFINNIAIGGPVGLGGRNISIYNNVFEGVFLRLDSQNLVPETAFINADVKNNVIIDSNIAYPVDKTGSSLAYLNEFINVDYNAYFLSDSWPYNNINAHGFGENSFVFYEDYKIDPENFLLDFFYDLESYRPKPSTVLINKGVSSIAKFDRDGKLRDSNPDIGMYEL